MTISITHKAEHPCSKQFGKSIEDFNWVKSERIARSVSGNAWKELPVWYLIRELYHSSRTLQAATQRHHENISGDGKVFVANTLMRRTMFRLMFDFYSITGQCLSHELKRFRLLTLLVKQNANSSFIPLTSMRSCGRLGPDSEDTTVDRSSVITWSMNTKKIK